ncbi:MAG: hypothetical protein M1269_12495 [Chloroflexi bacterium]|nr:hypothetical protein [Chloroflexota bacterium]
MRKKRRKQKKQFKRRDPDKSKSRYTGLLYKRIPSPFKGMPEDEITVHLKEMGEKFDIQYKESFQKLQERLLTVDPLLLLSCFPFYFLTTTLIDGKPKPKKESPILQHHVELLQGLVLRYRLEMYETKPVFPEDIEEFCELIKEVTHSFRMRYLSCLEKGMDVQKRYRLLTLEDIRVYTQFIRNWGSVQQIMRIVRSLFAPLDDEIERTIGIRISHLIDMLLKLITIIEDKVNSHWDQLIPIFQAETISSAIEEYQRSFPDIKSTQEELLQLFKERGATLREAQFMLISHLDLRLPDIFTFQLNDFVNNYPQPIEASTLRQVLNTWALSFGDLEEIEPDHFFMGNPIWKKPLVRIDKDFFFCPIAVLFVSFCLEIMESVIKTNSGLYTKYERRRANFLEDELDRLFKEAFPFAKVYRGSQWNDPLTHDKYENDLLILIDSHLIIVEAKSGKITEPARRGAELRLENTIEKLIIAPSDQSGRFADYLRENPGLHRFSTKQGIVNELDTSNVKEIIRLNVTLGSLGTLSSRGHDLREAGFIPKDIDIVPTMSISDLETVFDILEGNCQKLHYLTRRAQFEEHANYYGDEIDLLAFYTETGFNIGEEEFNNGIGLFIYGSSELFDSYLMSDLYGQKIPKPKCRLTKWWEDILQQIENRQPPRWTELGYLLLNVSYDDQKSFEESFKRVQKNVQGHWKIPGHKNHIILSNGPQQRRDAIVGLAYKQITIEERNQLIEYVAYNAMEITQTDRATVIGIDNERCDYPYSVIACLNKNNVIEEMIRFRGALDRTI